MIKLPWKRDVRPLEPRPMVNPRLLELQIAKQILEEIFHARPSDVDEMIRMSWKRRTGARRAGKKRRSHGQHNSAWVNSCGPKFRER
jgi:hypothetical protein